jgi:hypothetical protein
VRTLQYRHCCSDVAVKRCIASTANLHSQSIAQAEQDGMYELHEIDPAGALKTEQNGRNDSRNAGLNLKAFNPRQALPLNLVRILRPRCG